jgi:hypothetical protein
MHRFLVQGYLRIVGIGSHVDSTHFAGFEGGEVETPTLRIKDHSGPYNEKKGRKPVKQHPSGSYCHAHLL